MIKTLQKRFVVVAMVAVSLLLVTLIGVINIANALVTERQIDNLLDFLLRSDSAPIRGGGPRAPMRNEDGHSFNEDTRVSSLHFMAIVGDETKVDVRRIATVDEAAALKYVERAVLANKDNGKVDRFRFRSEMRGNERVYVFLDVTSQTRALTRIAGLSLLAGVVAFLLMLAIVVLMSRKAIRPIAENIARQKQFVTDAGHELKTPIAIILANTEAMELHTGESKWSKNIREQAARLGGLTQNLLALSRADEGAGKSESSFSLSDAVKNAAEAFCEPMSGRSLELVSEIEENVFVFADRDALSRVLSILFDNACRYAKEASKVKITLCGTEFKICNECAELPSCPPEKLFDRFYRADASRGSEGFGIGLSAAYALTNGKIKAQYIGQNKIEFTVNFT